MGAAGYVTIYEEAELRGRYDELWAEHGYSLEEDWWYPAWLMGPEEKYPRTDIVRVNLGGVWYLLDYADDQGNHEGTNNEFWFKSPGDAEHIDREWVIFKAAVPENEHPYVMSMSGDYRWGTPTPAQCRVLVALRRCKNKQRVEVWT